MVHVRGTYAKLVDSDIDLKVSTGRVRVSDTPRLRTGRSTRRHDDCNDTVADNCACHIQCAINRRIYSVSRDILKIHSQHIPEPLA